MPMPALLTRMSIDPIDLTAAATMFFTCSPSEMSTQMAVAEPPISSIAFAVCRAESRLMSATPTTAPASANSNAISRPMPLPPPVTTAFNPSKVISFSLQKAGLFLM